MSITSVVNDTVTSESVINALKPLPPTISGYSVGGLDDTALDPAGGQTVQINGTGFLAGATITFDGSAVAVVTYVNANQLTFTSPAKSAGTYTIYVVNPDGGTAIFIPGIIYSVLPTWTTSAGTLGSYYETTSISNTVVASGDAPITYSLFSGSLPTGATLYANGVITGTAPVDSSSTTYSFTIQATDAQLQDSTRSFSLTINVDAVTWVSPANNTTYTSAVDSAIANVALSATDAAGYAVSYSANALPTGLTLTGSNIAGTPTVIADSSTLLTATAATTNRTAVRTINWSITVANDPYFEYNTLLIPGASTTFVDDASTNNFAVSIFGDTKPNSFNPYTPGYYSVFMNGGSSGDLLSFPNSSTAYNLSGGTWTVEMWMYPTMSTFSDGDCRMLMAGANGNNTAWQLFIDSNRRIGWNLPAGGIVGLATANSAFSFNTWTHVAVVCQAGSARIYVNGVSAAGPTNVTLPTSATVGFKIGFDNVGTVSTQFAGFITNVRINTTTAIYTTAFTPSTIPLTAVSGTSLLTCQSNRYLDTSTNALSVTVAGSPRINSFDPFVPNSNYSTYGSGYFDGTGDYLTCSSSATNFSTSNFTIEFWVNFASLPSSGNNYDIISATVTNGVEVLYRATGNYIEIGRYAVGPSLQYAWTPSLGAWNHVAFVRSSTTVTIYINGTSVTSGTVSQDFQTGLTNIGSAGGTQSFFAGYLSDVRVVNGTAVYTSNFTPPSAPLTAIANTSLLTLQNNQSVNNSVFLDNSTNNFFVTRNGNTTQGTFSPYGGNWSNYFDGTGDYLQTTGSSALTLDGNFTIEAWVYQTTSNTYASIIASASATWTAGATNFFVLGSGNVPHLSTNPAGAGQIINGGTIVNNTWNHIAVSRTGTTASMWVNGTRVANVTLNATFNLNHNSGTKLGGGTWDGSGGNFFGYISNVRVIKGTDIYGISNTSITVPTTPLIPITNTSLLTCADSRFIDDSINNFTITKNGDVSVQRFSPFNPSSVTPTSYSGYFDGTGDVLTPPANNVFAFGTDSFCIEAWIFNNVLKNYSCLVTTRPNNSNYADAYHIGWDSVGGVSLYVNSTSTTGAPPGTITTGQWQHFVCCRDSSNRTAIFVNGTRVGSDTVTSNFTRNLLGIGDFPTTPAEGINGYISNLRLVKGNSVYDPTQTTITVPTSPLTTTSQGVTASTVSILTCQSPTFIDNSTNNFTITAVGNTQPTIQNPFGFTSATTNGYTVSTIGGSGYFDGTGDNLSIASQTQLQLTTGVAFTIECFAYPSAAFTINEGLIAKRTGANYDWQLGLGAGTANGQVFFWNGSTVYGSGINLILYQWNHVAVTWDLTTLRIFVNGILGTTYTSSFTLATQTNATVNIGANFIGGGEEFIGYISDVRLIKGTAVYKSNFIPPSAPLTAVQNTVLLNNMTSAGIYDAAMMTTMETVADAKLSTAVSKFGGSSMYFDGSGDYLSVPPNTQSVLLGAGSFTVEFWLYPAASQPTTRTPIISFGNGFTTNVWAIQLNNTSPSYVNRIQLWAYNLNSGAVVAASTGTISANTWTHVAVVRNGTGFTIYINGTADGTGTSSASMDGGSTTLQFQVGYNSPDFYSGYIDDLRITKGYARYTTNFTPPTTAFPIF